MSDLSVDFGGNLPPVTIPIGPRFTNNEIAAVLDEAADVIEQRGWCRGGNTNKQGHVCAQGAVNVVLSGNPHSGGDSKYKQTLKSRALYTVEQYLRFKHGWLGFITSWNDHQTDRRKVTRLFRRVARELRKDSNG